MATEENSRRSDLAQQTGIDGGMNGDPIQVYPWSWSLRLPGNPGSIFSIPDNTVDARRRTIIKNLLSRSSNNLVANTSQITGICAHHSYLDLKSIIEKPSPTKLSYQLGYIDDILSQSECRWCLFIQRWIHQNASFFMQDFAPVKCSLTSFPSQLSHDNDFRPAKDENQQVELLIEYADIHPDFKGPVPGYRFQVGGRQIQEKADLALARKWLDSCSENHGQTCNHRVGPASSSFEPIRLLDVKRRMVTTVSVYTDYVALSYVWGPDHYQTFKSNVKNSFNSKGELVDLTLPPQLPSTIEDAIYATEVLGFQYIWIDVLCIVQDCAHKKSQISRMAQIFSSAVLTIAASGGDNVQDPIPGIRSKRRAPSQEAISIDGFELLEISPRSKKSISKSTWSTRAWTFLERTLSKRCLIFTADQMFFHCLQESWCENTPENLQQRPSNQIRNLYSRIFETQQDGASLSSTYSFLVRSYSQRRLSIAKDVLLAFSGSVFMLEKTYATTFVYGLPLQEFHFALLWQPYEALQLRTNTGNTANPTFHNYGSVANDSYLPTWTWAAWVGEVFYPGDVTDMSDYREAITWSEFPSSHGNYKTLKFSTSYAKFRIRFPREGIMDRFEAGTLDWGITRVEHNENGTGLKKNGLKDQSSMTNVLILDDKEKAAGEIILDEAWQFSEKRSYTFIYICECRTIERTVWRQGWGGELDLEAVTDPITGESRKYEWKDEPWSYIKVMMIQEEGDAAYRLGVGTIHKDAWEEQKPSSKLFQLR